MAKCKWRKFKLGYLTNCGREINRKPLNFKFCPFCGKEIYIARLKSE